MKKDLQPQYNLAKVTCSTCGNEYEMGSTLEEIKVDTCANCHPFYTGSQTFVQAQGRVERFNRRYGLSKAKDEKAKTEDKE